MAVSKLDDWSTAVDSGPSDITVSSGSDRWLVVLAAYGHFSDAAPPTSMSVGGQSLTQLTGGEDQAGNNTSVSMWAINEAGIAAMSGTSFSVGGGTESRYAFAWLTIQDADQTAPTGSAIGSSQGSASTPSVSGIVRVADGITIAGGMTNAFTLTSTANPSNEGTVRPGSPSNDVFYGSELSSSETEAYNVTINSSREYEIVAANFGPAAAGGSTPKGGFGGIALNGPFSGPIG